MKIAVIGAGIIGVSIAAEAAARGADVALFDKNAPGSGTSSTSYAWINSNGKEPVGYYELNRAGLEAHRRLAGTGADWFRPSGHIELAATPEHADGLHRRLERLGHLGYEATGISSSTATELIPDLIVPEDCTAVACFPNEAHCYPALYIRHQLQRAAHLGVRLRVGAAVESFEETAEGVNVILSDGTSVLVDRVISAVGRWTNDITAAAGLGPVVTEYQEPGDVTVGYLAVTNPLPVDIDRILTSPKLNIRPAGGGRLLLQALDLDATATPDTVPAIDSDLAREFIYRLQEILKNTGNAHIVPSWFDDGRASPVRPCSTVQANAHPSSHQAHRNSNFTPTSNAEPLLHRRRNRLPARVHVPQPDPGSGHEPRSRLWHLGGRRRRSYGGRKPYFLQRTPDAVMIAGLGLIISGVLLTELGAAH